MAAKKKRKGSLPAGARLRSKDKTAARSQTTPPRSQSHASRSRATRSPSAAKPAHTGAHDVLWILSLVAAAALIAVVGIAYDGLLFAPYFLSRMLPLLPLALCLVLLALARVAPGIRPFRLDALDVAVLAFAAWQMISALASPTFAVAFFGYYNRGTGAVLWAALALIFVAARRLFDDPRSLRPLVWIVAAVLLLAAAVAGAQALGATDLWGGVAGQARLTGTTGNPISLGGLGLLAVWLGAGLPRWRRGSATWVVAGAGTAAGIIIVVLSVSRAAMAALLVCGIILVVVWVRRRRRAVLVTASIVAGLVILIAALYAAGPGTSLLTRVRGAPAGGLNSSDDKRVELWGEAMKGLKSHPLAGTGSGAFVVADRLYRPAERRVLNPWAMASDPHSLPLFVASGSGLIGLLAGGFVSWLLIGRLWRRSHPRSDGGDDGDEGEGSSGGEIERSRRMA